MLQSNPKVLLTIWDVWNKNGYLKNKEKKGIRYSICRWRLDKKTTNKKSQKNTPPPPPKKKQNKKEKEKKDSLRE